MKRNIRGRKTSRTDTAKSKVIAYDLFSYFWKKEERNKSATVWNLGKHNKVMIGITSCQTKGNLSTPVTLSSCVSAQTPKHFSLSNWHVYLSDNNLWTHFTGEQGRTASNLSHRCPSRFCQVQTESLPEIEAKSFSSRSWRFQTVSPDRRKLPKTCQ